jgi:CIC family chloride channel protein
MGAAGGGAFGMLCLSLIPGLNVDLATFAIAGMAAMIGGTTGAILTGMIMLTEMTQDNSVILPLIITCSIAYAVRKWIMNESIYTAKLVARGHIVPEGLEAAVMTTNRVHDLMETDFAVSAAGVEPPADRAVVVHSEGGRIDRVTLHRGTAHSDPSTSLAASVPYTVSTGQTMLLTAVCGMWAAEAQIILVSRDPTSRRSEDIIGVVTSASIARFLQAEAELL